MQYRFEPVGVCSSEYIIDIDGDTIKNIEIEGGCPGNTQAVAILLKGMKIKDAIEKLKGIQCGFRGTSCPDQIAHALEEILENK